MQLDFDHSEYAAFVNADFDFYHGKHGKHLKLRCTNLYFKYLSSW